jgi:hypothetical protein
MRALGAHAELACMASAGPIDGKSNDASPNRAAPKPTASRRFKLTLLTEWTYTPGLDQQHPAPPSP